jgi:hypothetical protein
MCKICVWQGLTKRFMAAQNSSELFLCFTVSEPGTDNSIKTYYKERAPECTIATLVKNLTVRRKMRVGGEELNKEFSLDRSKHGVWC